MSTFAAVDGNFRLQSKLKNLDPDDTPLGGGYGYFCDHKKYKKYLDTVQPSNNVSSVWAGILDLDLLKSHPRHLPAQD